MMINKRLPTRDNEFVRTLGKVVVDQLIGAPIYIYLYYCVTHFSRECTKHLQQKKENNNNKETNKSYITTNNDNNNTATIKELMKETSDRAIKMLPGTIVRHWTVWPAIHTLNFYYNPIHCRALFQNFVLIAWLGYLSHLNNGGLATQQENHSPRRTNATTNDNDDHEYDYSHCHFTTTPKEEESKITAASVARTAVTTTTLKC